MTCSCDCSVENCPCKCHRNQTHKTTDWRANTITKEVKPEINITVKGSLVAEKELLEACGCAHGAL